MPDKVTSDVIGRMLGSHDQDGTIDTETLIQETQTRVWGALKKGYEYAGVTNPSEAYLRRHVLDRLDMVCLYVDLVGSTQMALQLPSEKIAIIISSFAQEMASVIRQYDGLVLKFVGDAVIGYFTADDNPLLASDRSINCAKSMLEVIDKGINPILNQYDYPDLLAKIGLDFGQNIVVRYGSDPEMSDVDIIGPAMNIAAKIQAMARPNQILIGYDVYSRLHPETKREFEEIVWQKNEWKYRARGTGRLYPVYAYKP